MKLFSKLGSLRKVVIRFTFLSVLSAIFLTFALTWHWNIHFWRYEILLALTYPRILWITWIDLTTANNLPIFASLRRSIYKIVDFWMDIVFNLNSLTLSRIASRFCLFFALFFIFVREQPERIFNLVRLHGIIWITLLVILIHRLELLVILGWVWWYLTSRLFLLALTRWLLRLH